MSDYLTKSIIFCLIHYPQLTSAWVDHYDEGEDDAKVVKVFLPLICCAILTCIGGCYFKKHCVEEIKEDGDEEKAEVAKSEHEDAKSKIIDPVSDFNAKMMARRESRMTKGKSFESADGAAPGLEKIDPTKNYRKPSNKSNDPHPGARRNSSNHGEIDFTGHTEKIDPKHFNPSIRGGGNGHFHQQPLPRKPSRNQLDLPGHTNLGFDPNHDTASHHSIMNDNLPQAQTRIFSQSHNLQTQENNNNTSTMPPVAVPRSKLMPSASIHSQHSNLSSHPSRRGSRHKPNNDHVSLDMTKDISEMTEEELLRYQQTLKSQRSNSQRNNFPPPSITSLPNRMSMSNKNDDENQTIGYSLS